MPTLRQACARLHLPPQGHTAEQSRVRAWVELGRCTTRAQCTLRQTQNYAPSQRKSTTWVRSFDLAHAQLHATIASALLVSACWHTTEKSAEGARKVRTRLLSGLLPLARCRHIEPCSVHTLRSVVVTARTDFLSLLCTYATGTRACVCIHPIRHLILRRLTTGTAA